jgi:SAM-dependent methyltransferase
MPTPADWQLPPGVSREVWVHLQDSTAARRYDESLTGTPLLELDQDFVTRRHRPGRVLDLGCGTGRLAIPLARLGHAVTGVDLSQPMLQIARGKAASAGVRLDLVRANIVELECLGDSQFDNALIMFSTLGMVAGDAARRRVIEHTFRLLRPGGMLNLHVHSCWHHLWTRMGRRWLIRDLGRRLAGRSTAGDWHMAHHGGLAGWTMHLFTRGEAIGLVCAAGFRVVEVLPAGLRPDGRLRFPWLIPGMRAYGFLIAAQKPELAGGTAQTALS